MKKVLIILLAFTLLCSCGCSAKEVDINAKDVYTVQNKLIADLYTDKSAYKPNEIVKLNLSLKNQTSDVFDGTIQLRYKYLNQTIKTEDIKMKLQKAEEKSVPISWVPPANDYKGYLVEAVALKANVIQDQKNTAVDVSSTWTKFPRYGYLCNYDGISKEKAQGVIEELCKYHINGLQFYDWQNSHDQPLAGTVENPVAEWHDIANRTVSAATITNYINASHQKNIMACNYNLMFAAYNDYENRGIKKEWALYKDEQHQLQDFHPLPASWASNLNLMNPANTEWQNYLLTKEKDAFQVYDFDVFHVDTLGYRGTLYDYNGNKVNLVDTYIQFLNNAKAKLNKGVVMNAVNGYGAKEAAQANTDFLYTEVWTDSNPNYSNLKQAIDNNNGYSNGKKASVIAAYMNYKASGQAFNENAVKLTDSVIFASGASHLELGDTGMLSSEYFPNEKMFMSDQLKTDLRSYYDFLVAYENILHEQNKQLDFNGSIDNYKVSSTGDAGTIWTFGAENGTYQTVQMINLLSRSDAQWRDDSWSCENPKEINSFHVTMDYNKNKVKGVYLASPDLKGGSMLPLTYTLSNGKLQIQVPTLKYWDMILIEK